MHADHVGRKKIYRLAKHPSLSFNSANAPGDDPKPVDHRCMRVRTNERVGKVNTIFLKYAFGKVLKVDLMDYTDARRNDAEPVKCLRSPFQEAISLVVSPEFDLHVPLVSDLRTGKVNLHAVIDHQVHWD